MGKHTNLHNQKQIREVTEFANHIDDLAKRIRGFDMRKMIRNS